MVCMEMTDSDEIEVREIRAGFGKPKERSAAIVDEVSGLSVDPNYVTGGCPPVVGNRAA